MDVFDSLHSELQFRKIEKRGKFCNANGSVQVGCS